MIQSFIRSELRDYLIKIPNLDLDLLFDCWSKPLPEGFRVNTLKLPEEYILERLREKNTVFRKISWARYGYILETEFQLGTMIEHMLGLIYLQGPVSMAPVEALDPSPGDIILDMCAAPGSKSTQISQLLQGRGVLVANDPIIDRCKALSSNLQKFGVYNVVITTLDGRVFPKMVGEFFDKVLVDAPCSSLGIVSKDWRIVKNWSMDNVYRLSRLQLQLLRSAFDCLKPGGALVYSTCTLTIEENELVVHNLLESRDNAYIEEIKLDGLRYEEGLTEWNNLRLNEELLKSLRIYPYHNSAEGFYIVKIRKSG
ncbi:MAG: NOL1/NOP2/sun family putative RNA methylase [Nitrososphaerota archaeon]